MQAFISYFHFVLYISYLLYAKYLVICGCGLLLICVNSVNDIL